MPVLSLSIPQNEFNLNATVESGQIFGFDRLDNNSASEGPLSGYRIRIRGAVRLIRQWPDRLEVSGEGASGPAHPVETEIRRYFDLDRDLSPVYRLLLEDACLQPALEAFRGLRIIRQDPWEALAGFILSSNNHLPRIKKIWRALCVEIGGADLVFPSCDRIAAMDEPVLRKLGLGYRAPYLLQSSRKIAAGRERYLDLSALDDTQAKERLMELPGIGPKVAECALLYGFGRYTAFPVDVWIERALKKLYWRGRRRSITQAERYGKRRWKERAGYIQQYLFHASRLRLI